MATLYRLALQVSETIRTGPGQWLAEAVATFGLMFTILVALRFRSYAIARALSDTFAGIRPTDLPGFILAQIIDALAALLLIGWLLAERKPLASPLGNMKGAE